MKVESLLSDEFMNFSAKIKELHDEKKQCEEEFKKVYAEYKSHVKKLDEEALNLQQEFDEWVASKEETD